jgi:hypothetical protein
MRSSTNRMIGLMLSLCLAAGRHAQAQDARAETAPVPPLPPDGREVFTYAVGASFEDKVVTGAPYTAEAVTEFVQTLGDGNRITRKTTASVYRDGQGRTRRDQSLGALALMAGGEPPQQVIINDPAAGVSVVLDPRTKTAERLRGPHTLARESESKGKGPAKVTIVRSEPIVVEGPGASREDVLFEAALPPAGAPGPLPLPLPPPSLGLPFGAAMDHGSEGKSESLGKQVIEGVEAEGTRTTTVIAPGQIGNEQAIQIVSERWYAPDLRVVVLSRHSDPRFGETSYRLVGIVRGEPERTLFEVPSDYKVRDQPASREVVIRRIEKSAPPE